MKAVITVISDLSTDMRVLKFVRLMAEEGLTVTVIGRHSPAPLPSPIPGVRFVRIAVPWRRGPMMYLLFNASLLVRLLFMRFTVCLASDLDTLLPAYILSSLPGRHLIYDAHEYFTGQHGLEERPLIHSVWKRAERMVLPRIREMITVSDSIAALYRDEYGVDPVVVRNVAPATSHLEPVSREKLGAAGNELLVIFQGAGINPGRGGVELIRAMTLTRGVKLIIIGSGDSLDSLRQQAEESGSGEVIRFLPRMPWEEMMRHTKGCDAGLSLDHDSCINQRYSLPNKLFDYISAGIPAVVSPLPEVTALAERYGCGVILDKVTPEAIAEKLQLLADHPGLLRQLREKAAEASAELTWERERIKGEAVIRRVTARAAAKAKKRQ